MGADAVVVAGGAEIYAQTIRRADRLALTEVALAPPGEAVFPLIDPAGWREVARDAACAGRTTRRTSSSSSTRAVREFMTGRMGLALVWRQ